jgi:hypothetical protein
MTYYIFCKYETGAYNNNVAEFMVCVIIYSHYKAAIPYIGYAALAANQSDVVMFCHFCGILRGG